MKHQIKVSGIKLYAYHGCLPEEGLIGGHYIVNVVMHTDFTQATETDDLMHTIDYVAVNHIVKEEMAIRSKLIEHVGQRIVTRIKTEIKGIAQLEVEIVKLCPPINGDVESVSVVISE